MGGTIINQLLYGIFITPPGVTVLRFASTFGSHIRMAQLKLSVQIKHGRHPPATSFLTAYTPENTMIDARSRWDGIVQDLMIPNGEMCFTVRRHPLLLYPKAW